MRASGTGKLGAATPTASAALVGARWIVLRMRHVARSPGMSGPARTSLHDSNSGTCESSPTHNDCGTAEPGGSAAQSQHPRRSTNRPACGRCQPYGRRHRTARVWTRISSTILFYGWFGTETRESLALTCHRINLPSPPRVRVRGSCRPAIRVYSI